MKFITKKTKVLCLSRNTTQYVLQQLEKLKYTCGGINMWRRRKKEIDTRIGTQMQFCVSFIASGSQNGSFQTQSCLYLNLCFVPCLWSWILGNDWKNGTDGWAWQAIGSFLVGVTEKPWKTAAAGYADSCPAFMGSASKWFTSRVTIDFLPMQHSLQK